jgi:DNA-binding response OmpR family regulator
MNRVLVVEDSYNERQLTRQVLEREGFEVAEAPDGHRALTIYDSAQPDVVLLDLAMAGMGGLEVLAHLRRKGDTPVIIVSATAEESQRVLALELGADDYVVKPFLIRELPARVRTVLRRSKPSSVNGCHVFGDLQIRIAEREVMLDGRLVPMPSKEFDLLARLAAEPRRVFSRETLLKEVWGSSGDWQDPATVTEHIRRLRHKIERHPADPAWILTVRGAGYRFEPPEA